MSAHTRRFFFLGDGVQASRPIVWLIGFFAFLNVYSIQAVLPMVMEDFHASPLQAGLTVGATVLAVARRGLGCRSGLREFGLERLGDDRHRGADAGSRHRRRGLAQTLLISSQLA